MACNCGKRRTYQAVTSANHPRAAITPAQSAANAIANARSVDQQGEESTVSATTSAAKSSSAGKQTKK